ncbi:MAG: hypothetical protein EOP04_03915 [Proteobacteria bacterium]|nr:MAG: hypothetical protein EOP04_03915 [Pseudomonadota bacterium]
MIGSIFLLVTTFFIIISCKGSDSESKSQNQIKLINNDSSMSDINQDLVFQSECILRNLAAGLYARDYLGLSENRFYFWSSYYSTPECAIEGTQYSIGYAQSAKIIEGNNQNGKFEATDFLPSLTYVRDSSKLTLQIDAVNTLQYLQATNAFSMPPVPQWQFHIVDRPNIANGRLTLSLNSTAPEKALVNNASLFGSLSGQLTCINKNSSEINLGRLENINTFPLVTNDFPLDETGTFAFTSSQLLSYDISLLEKCVLRITSIYEKSGDQNSYTVRSTFLREIDIPIN